MGWGNVDTYEDVMNSIYCYTYGVGECAHICGCPSHGLQDLSQAFATGVIT